MIPLDFFHQCSDDRILERVVNERLAYDKGSCKIAEMLGMTLVVVGGTAGGCRCDVAGVQPVDVDVECFR